MSKTSNFFYNNWVYITGKTGWTEKQILFGYLFIIFFALMAVYYPIYAQLEWTWIQLFAAGFIALDLSAGLVGYNHQSIKFRQAKEKGKLHYFHHNLQHLHPLILIFFHNETILLGLTIYWMFTSVAYVRFLTYNAETASRTLASNKQQLAVIIYELTIATAIISLSFFVDDVARDFQVFGITAYAALPILTFILINVPIGFQRTVSTTIVMFMIMMSMYNGVPDGFAWLYPIYFLKLLTGFTAREELPTSS